MRRHAPSDQRGREARMREALRSCALLLAVVTFSVADDAVTERNATDVNATEISIHDVEIPTKPNVKDYSFTTEPVFLETTVSIKTTSDDAKVNASETTSDVTVENVTPRVTSDAAVSDANSRVTSNILPEADESNETQSNGRSLSSNTSFTRSQTYETELTSESTVDENPFSAPNVSWSSSDDSPSVTLTSCEMTTERRLSVIQSPGFPSPYAPDVECRYAVKRYSLDVCSVTFLFNVFDLESSEACSKDYVDLHGERLCGAKTTGLTRSVPFRSAVDDQVVLRFRSDDSISGVGFMATVVQQECPPPDCDHQFTGLKFEVRSPGFPAPYENRQLCDYTVVRAGPRICRIRLQVRLFDVEAADHCDADSLEIKGDKLCGNIPAGEIVSVDFREPLLMIRFRSDHTTTRDGFHLLGTQEECAPEDSTSNATVVSEGAR